jgi:hypothetical protein
MEEVQVLINKLDFDNPFSTKEYVLEHYPQEG